jgi:hypothetical protein
VSGQGSSLQITTYSEVYRLPKGWVHPRSVQRMKQRRNGERISARDSNRVVVMYGRFDAFEARFASLFRCFDRAHTDTAAPLPATELFRGIRIYKGEV